MSKPETRTLKRIATTMIDCWYHSHRPALNSRPSRSCVCSLRCGQLLGIGSCVHSELSVDRAGRAMLTYAIYLSYHIVLCNIIFTRSATFPGFCVLSWTDSAVALITCMRRRESVMGQSDVSIVGEETCTVGIYSGGSADDVCGNAASNSSCRNTTTGRLSAASCCSSYASL